MLCYSLRLRLPPELPFSEQEATTGRYATPSSISFFDRRHKNAHTAED
jgi:hypothetical protein